MRALGFTCSCRGARVYTNGSIRIRRSKLAVARPWYILKDGQPMIATSRKISGRQLMFGTPMKAAQAALQPMEIEQ